MLFAFLGVMNNDRLDCLRRNQIVVETDSRIASVFPQKTAELESRGRGDLMVTIVRESLVGVDREMALRRIGILVRELCTGFRVGRRQ